MQEGRKWKGRAAEVEYSTRASMPAESTDGLTGVENTSVEQLWTMPRSERGNGIGHHAGKH